jgi:hypothetical protein
VHCDPDTDHILDTYIDRMERAGAPYSISTAGEVAYRAGDPAKFVLIGELTRPGVRLFFVSVECELFPPSTPLNEAFELCVLPWQGLPWGVAMAPNIEVVTEAVAAIAARCGLLLFDAVPMLCDAGGRVAIYGSSRPGQPGHLKLMRRGTIHWFPVHGDNARTLETAPGGRQYDPDDETALATAVWWEWEEKHGKHKETP